MSIVAHHHNSARNNTASWTHKKHLPPLFDDIFCFGLSTLLIYYIAEKFDRVSVYLTKIKHFNLEGGGGPIERDGRGRVRGTIRQVKRK